MQVRRSCRWATGMNEMQFLRESFTLICISQFLTVSCSRYSLFVCEGVCVCLIMQDSGKVFRQWSMQAGRQAGRRTTANLLLHYHTARLCQPLQAMHTGDLCEDVTDEQLGCTMSSRDVRFQVNGSSSLTWGQFLEVLSCKALIKSGFQRRRC